MRSNGMLSALVGAALLATTAFGQGRGGPGGPGGGMRMGGPGGGMAMAGGMAAAGGQCAGMGAGQGTATAAATVQAAAVMRAMGINSGSNNSVQSGFQPEMQQAMARQAYAQQQNAIAAAKAAKEQERRDKIKSSIIAQREKELAKRGKSPASKSAEATQSSESFATSR